MEGRRAGACSQGGWPVNQRPRRIFNSSERSGPRDNPNPKIDPSRILSKAPNSPQDRRSSRYPSDTLALIADISLSSQNPYSMRCLRQAHGVKKGFDASDGSRSTVRVWEIKYFSRGAVPRRRNRTGLNPVFYVARNHRTVEGVFGLPADCLPVFPRLVRTSESSTKTRAGCSHPRGLGIRSDRPKSSVRRGRTLL